MAASSPPRGFLLNLLSVLGGESAARIATLAMAVLVGHRFGAAGLGAYGYAVALASVLLLVPDCGSHLLVTREVAARPDELAGWFWAMQALKWRLATVVVVGTVALELWGLHDPGRRLLLGLLMARALLQTYSQGCAAVFRALERMHFIAGVQGANAATVLACVGVAWFWHASLGMVTACLLAGQMVETGLAWRFVRVCFPTGPHPRRFSPTPAAMFLAALPLGVTTLLQALSLRLDVLVLSLRSPNAVLGRFQACAYLLLAAYLAASLLMTVLFPKLARVLRGPRQRGRVYAAHLTKYSLLTSVPISLLVWKMAPRVLAVLFGPRLASASGLLRLLIPALPLLFLNTVLFYVLVAARRRAAYLGVTAAGVGVGVVLQFVLAGAAGARGSAIADVVTQLVMAAGFLGCVLRAIWTPRLMRHAVRIGLGAVTIALAAAALSWLRPPLDRTAISEVALLAGSLWIFGRPRLRELLFLSSPQVLP